MGVYDAVLGQVVVEVDAYFCAAADTQDGPEIVAGKVLHRHAGAAQQLAGIAPDTRLRACKDLHGLFCCGDRHLGVWYEGLCVHLGYWCKYALRTSVVGRLDLPESAKTSAKQRDCTNSRKLKKITPADELRFHFYPPNFTAYRGARQALIGDIMVPTRSRARLGPIGVS